MHPDDIKKIIEENLQNATATVKSNDGRHFSINVICPAFAGKSLLQQQRMVYELLNTQIKNGDIHALTLKTTAGENHP